MKIEQKIEKLGYRIPEAPKSLGAYVPAVRVGNLLFVGGKIPLVEGQLRTCQPSFARKSFDSQKWLFYERF